MENHFLLSDKIDICIKNAEEGLSEMIKDGESDTYLLDAYREISFLP